MLHQSAAAPMVESIPQSRPLRWSRCEAPQAPNLETPVADRWTCPRRRFAEPPPPPMVHPIAAPPPTSMVHPFAAPPPPMVEV